jgi:hypothetical protein
MDDKNIIRLKHINIRRKKYINILKPPVVKHKHILKYIGFLWYFATPHAYKSESRVS